MKIAVMGAGAVGCYYGGMLARAGHDVVLIGRPLHVSAILQQGLFLDLASFQGYVPVKASTEASAVQGAELVLCCVKSSDTAQVAAAMAPFLAADALVLSLQNGLGNVEQLQEQCSQRIAPAVVYVAAEMAGPGRVKHHGRGELVLAPDVLTPEQQRLWQQAGIPIECSAAIASALWSKLAINCVFNALSAITQQPYGVLWRGKHVEAVMRDLVAECMAVAQAEGVRLPDSLWARVLQIVETMPGQCSSTAQDLARGKKSEITYLNGYVVRQGERHGIATPVNRALCALVLLLESGFAATAG